MPVMRFHKPSEGRLPSLLNELYGRGVLQNHARRRDPHPHISAHIGF